MPYDHLVTISIMAESGAGQTSLLDRFFHEKYDPSKPLRAYDGTYDSLDKHFQVENSTVKLQYQKIFNSIFNPTHNNGWKVLGISHCIIIPLDLSDKIKFEDLSSIKGYIDYIDFHGQREPSIVFVGTKSDIKDADLSPEDIQQVQEKLKGLIGPRKFHYMETSAKDNKNVTALFELTAKLSMEAQALEKKQAQEDSRKKELVMTVIPAEIDNFHLQIKSKLKNELTDFLSRKGIRKGESPQDLDLIDRRRHDVVEKLLKAVDEITDATKKGLTIDNIDTWKKKYQQELNTVVITALKNKDLDKYGSIEKLGITLLNIISIIFSPIKKFVTGSYFYSTTGKTKEAVEEVARSINTTLSFKEDVNKGKSGASEPANPEGSDENVKPKRTK